MTTQAANWRIRARRAAHSLRATLVSTVLLAVAVAATSPAYSQSIMRTPNLNIGSRIPTVGAAVAPRVTPNIGGRDIRIDHITVTRTPSPHLTARMAVKPQLPYARYAPNLYPSCGAADRDADGECLGEPVATADGGGGSSAAAKRKNGRPRRELAATPLSRTIAGEILAEIDSALTDAQADELARRHGLRRIEAQNLPLIGVTIALFRATDRRPVETVSRELATEAGVRSVQPNFRYLLQEQKAQPAEGDPAQYALLKLRLPEAHTVDSHEGPHVHGTGIAGAIVSHARLMGGAPAARILAIRAFVVASGTAQSSSFAILRGLDYAAAHGAQIVNMSFAGPKDALIERGLAGLAAKGVVMVAAAGNAGAKSPPLYPAANPNVIAVSATDADDHLLTASNRGSHIAVAAPGVDILLPAPDQKYQITSGTSFSAAYVSALAALMLEHNPALTPQALRTALTRTARDLGSPGRDDLFGAGEADAYAAVRAVTETPTPLAVSAPPNEAATRAMKTGENASEPKELPGTRALDPPVATMASEKSDSGDSRRTAGQ